MRTNLCKKIVWSSLVFLHIVFILTIDFIPSSAKIGLDAFNLGILWMNLMNLRYEG
jgi:hypothetical protein